jgi:hypothetical protein
MSNSNPLLRQIFKVIFILPILLLIPGYFVFSAPQPEPAAASDHNLYLPLAYYGDLDLYISAVKVIQGTTMSDRYKVYIADRLAMMRVFVGIEGGSKVVGVTGKLCGYNQSGASLGCLAPNNGSITAPSFEANINRTLNFSLPDDWLKPGYAYHVEINQDHHIAESDKSNNRYPIEGTQQFDFVPAPELDVVVVLVRYKPFGSSESHFPEMDDYSDLTNFPEKVLPIPAANLLSHAQIDYMPDEASLNLDTIDGWKKLLNIITTLQDSEDPSGTHIYYGLVNSYDAHGCNPSCIVGVANLGKRGAVGWSGLGGGTVEASKTLTHELGHNFDRKHVPCPGTITNNDNNYPYPDGTIGVYGLDVEEKTLIDPTTFFDFMSYCQNIWTSDYTYWNIYKFRESKLSLASDAAYDGEAMYIRGTLSPQDEVTLLPVYRQQVQTSLPQGGDYAVDLLDDEEQILATYNFEMLEIADSPGHQHFGFFVPSVDEAVGLRLREGERILAEKIIQSRPDSMKLDQETLVFDTVGEGTVVSWPEVSHPDQPVHYRLRLSKDNGASWQVLALDWKDSSFLLLVLADDDRNKSLLEIQASDGIHTSTQIYPIHQIP